jgi:hypothetical protein
MLMTSIVIAEDKISKWFDKGTPSEKIDTTTKSKLIETDKFIWNTTQYWKENNCYYFNLFIGNETNVTWEDNRRELICTQKTLSDAEVNDLQLANIQWTLEQLGKPTIIESPIVRIEAKKDENLKENTQK